MNYIAARVPLCGEVWIVGEEDNAHILGKFFDLLDAEEYAKQRSMTTIFDVIVVFSFDNTREVKHTYRNGKRVVVS